MKRCTFQLLLIFLVQYAVMANDPKPLYKDSTVFIENRIKDLLSRMNLEEKILQLNQYAIGINDNTNNAGDELKQVPAGIGSLIFISEDPIYRNSIQKKAMEESRLGIPILFGYDVIHGYHTIYPISLAQACSWNPALVSSACAVAAKEAKMSGTNWTFSPMIDVA
jgi:beta-glucosidase